MKENQKRLAQKLARNHKVTAEDLGLKIGSPVEVLWTAVRDGCQTKIKNFEDALILERAVLELAEKKIKEEKEAFMQADYLEKHKNDKE
jgi:hypothetical protein